MLARLQRNPGRRAALTLALLGILLGAALLLLQTPFLNAQDGEVRALVTRQTGQARARSPEQDWRALRVGSRLYSGDRIQTGPQARLVVGTPLGEVRLGEKSEVVLEEILSAQNESRVEVRRGFSWFAVDPKKDAAFRAATPTTTASVRGTKFSLAADDSGTVSCVCEGEIETWLNDRPGEKRPAVQGDSNDYSADGEFEQLDFRPFFRGLKVDQSFQAEIERDPRLASCTNCHRMTDLATDNSPDPTDY